MGGEALAQFVPSFPIPGSVQGQVGQGLEQFGTVERACGHGRGWDEVIFTSLPTQTRVPTQLDQW